MEARLQTQRKSSATPNQAPNDAHSFLANGFAFDPIFLEESWSLGLPAAFENHCRRQQLTANQSHQSDQARASREPQPLSTLRFLEDRQQAASSALMDRAAAVIDRYDTPSQAWAPQDWIPQDRATQSRIPQGWMPEYMPLGEPAGQPQPYADSRDTIMTAQRARLLLEVDPTDTREQVRSAYRRMVGQWHPDRLHLTSEAVRIHATQHMAALNEAYRLLCATELQQAA